MRALTIRHPYSYAIIQWNWGKLVENRSRNIAGSYRGPVAIHQAVHEAHVTGPDVDLITYCLDADEEQRQSMAQRRAWVARGEVIGVVDLVDVHHATDCYDADTKRLIALYNSGPEGRREVEAMPDNGCGGIIGKARFCSLWAHDEMFHLVFANPRLIVYPVPVRGQLGLWTLPDDVEQAVRRQL